MLEGQAPITGAVFTVTEKEQEELPQLLVAVQVTVVTPLGKVVPEAGEQDTVGVGEPVAVGVAKVTAELQVMFIQ